MPAHGIRRRDVLIGGVVGVAGTAVVAGCAGSGRESGAGTTAAGSGGASTGAGSGSGPSSGGGSTDGGTELVAVSEIPVGGAVSATSAGGDPLIVSRPKEGQVVAFSAICTHMGCTVAPDGSKLRCPCHGSVYEAATGQNIAGPAPRPLPDVTVHVVGGEVVQG